MSPFSLFLPFHFSLSLPLTLTVLNTLHLIFLYIWILFSGSLQSSSSPLGFPLRWTVSQRLGLEERVPEHMGIVWLVGSTDRVFGVITDLFRSLVYKQFSVLALKIIIHFPKFSNVLAYTDSLVMILTFFLTSSSQYSSPFTSVSLHSFLLFILAQFVYVISP